MGDTTETNTKVLYRELFLGVVALKTPIPQNHYLRDKVPFLKSGHTCMCKLHVLIFITSTMFIIKSFSATLKIKAVHLLASRYF